MVFNAIFNNISAISWNTEVKLPRRKSSVWVLVKKKLSVAEKGATPIQWKIVGLVFMSLVM
jgi:hypothetical protein